MSFARVCVEVSTDASLPSTVHVKTSKTDVNTTQDFTEINIAYQWKPSRCGKCNKVGHFESHCKPVRMHHPSSKSKIDPKPHYSNDLGKPFSHYSANPRKVTLGPIKPPHSDAIVVFKTAKESGKPNVDIGFENIGSPSNLATGSSTWSQKSLVSCPDVSSSNSFEVLQLESDFTLLQDSNLPIVSNQEEVQLESLDKALLEHSGVLEDFIPLSSILALKDKDQEHFPTTCIGSCSLNLSLQLPTPQPPPSKSKIKKKKHAPAASPKAAPSLENYPFSKFVDAPKVTELASSALIVVQDRNKKMAEGEILQLQSPLGFNDPVKQSVDVCLPVGSSSSIGSVKLLGSPTTPDYAPTSEPISRLDLALIVPPSGGRDEVESCPITVGNLKEKA
ncbi:hypothetical protein Nepgr_012414 [Nepenthes gracilis]|uniref:Uncharacterized protein n=1 Tax=Nepenthes gracilis TaxID=150966 RepID=A0AAD3XN25_NEPGR|nr:hypothetical protein Nepgr_012414 [Nepenthes gracilis]